MIDALLFQVIKLQGWEGQFLKNVEDARNLEFVWLRRYMFLVAMNVFIVWSTPLATSVAIFAACIYFGNGLSPGLAFTIIATVRITQEPLRLFPNALILLSQVNFFMQTHELKINLRVLNMTVFCFLGQLFFSTQHPLPC